MSINIKTAAVSLMIITVAVSLLLLGAVLDLSRESKELELIEHNRYLMYEKSSELKQSSDDLTKYALLYTVTGDEKNRDTYFEILNIRNGKAKRPLKYASTYWDISEPIRSQRDPLGEPSTLNSAMQKLPYLPYELEKLEEAEFNSNTLVALEVEAFYAMLGLFKDAAGGYTIKGKVNQPLAISLLTSEEYNLAKEKIMLPITDFMNSLMSRTEQEVYVSNALINAAFLRIYILLYSCIIILILAAFYVKKRVLSPIATLTSIIAAFKNGDESYSKTIVCNDEIGVMTESFFEMKDMLDAELLKTKKLAITDPLTGIKNRRHFFDIAESILKIAHRSKEPVSILMIDVDEFKAVNDKYGHVIGDEVLVYIVREIGSQLREGDVFARYGGEEFIVLLPKTNIDGAFDTAEKIRVKIEGARFIKEKTSQSITVSIGAAEVEHGKVIGHVIQKADSALYEAKEGGRNRVA